MGAGRLPRRRAAVTGHRYARKEQANHRNQFRHYFVHWVLFSLAPDTVVSFYIVLQREWMSAESFADGIAVRFA